MPTIVAATWLADTEFLVLEFSQPVTTGGGDLATALNFNNGAIPINRLGATGIDQGDGTAIVSFSLPTTAATADMDDWCSYLGDGSLVAVADGAPVPAWERFPVAFNPANTVPISAHFTEDESIVCTFDGRVFSPLAGSASTWERRNEAGLLKVFGNLYELQPDASTVSLTTGAPGATVGTPATCDFNGPDTLLDAYNRQVQAFADFPCPFDPP